MILFIASAVFVFSWIVYGISLMRIGNEPSVKQVVVGLMLTLGLVSLLLAGLFGLLHDFKRDPVLVKSLELKRDIENDSHFTLSPNGAKVDVVVKTKKGEHRKTMRQSEVYVSYDENEAVIEEYFLSPSPLATAFYGESWFRRMSDSKEYIIRTPDGR